MSQPPARYDEYLPSEKGAQRPMQPMDPYEPPTTTGMAQAHTQPTSYEPYDDGNDPYSVPARYPGGNDQHSKRHSGSQQDGYPPYSPQSSDPFGASSEPMYFDDDKEGANGLLADNMVAMDMMEQYESPQKRQKDQVSEMQQRKRKRRGCGGLTTRWMVFAAFVLIILVALAWFFVWPRWPNSILFQNAGVITPYDSSDPESKIYEAVWQINLTVDNSENFVPTHFKEFHLKLYDGSTNVKIGEGSTGSFMIPGQTRDKIIPITVNVQYSASDAGDPTLKNLFYCASLAQNETASQDTQLGINLLMYLEESISGIAWKETATIHPSIVACPK
ncbi:hypothetical protein LRAMOSA06674 [Lichtheimia ramosa]|uniref:Uncharacterized protein n=1 Tax=Lichtheimia ramosa TaxID=688394 RepID=A0A077X4I6_9FUNG|nr:hypothetical protein LRAMOSA06674 [Lichtheimia ramosa]